MRCWRRAAVLAVAIVAFACVGSAAQAEWEGSARVGVLSSSGNTESDSYNARLDLRYETDSWDNRVNVQALGAREEARTTSETYELGGRLSYSRDSSNFWFVRGNARRDRFGGYDRQISQSVGYARRLLELDRHRLDAEVGAGARQARRQDGEPGNEAILRMAAEYHFDLTDETRFDFELASERGRENTVTEAEASWRSQVLRRVALVLSYSLVNNSRVAEEQTNTDTYTSVSVEYAFP